MALLSALKLVTAKRSASASPVVQRRNKLIKQLHEQWQMASAIATGTTYAPTKTKTGTNAETGERVSLTVPKRLKQWWWVGETGKLQLAVRYGARVLPLNKSGANAIEANDTADVAAKLELLKQAVAAGELDTAMEAVSKSVRANFK